ncbi:hypothetical protein PENTCL1PPCAC_25914, partial [Pristionchus entomophagus]
LSSVYEVTMGNEVDKEVVLPEPLPNNELVAQPNDGGGQSLVEEGEEEHDANINNDNAIVFKLKSPASGKWITLVMFEDEENKVTLEEMFFHFEHLFQLRGLNMKTSFEDERGGVPWNYLAWWDFEMIQDLVEQMNETIKSRASSNCLTSKWFMPSPCTARQIKQLSIKVFKRVVKNARVLNHCYKGFSSFTYGETTPDQLEIIFNRLKMTEKDVFVDLGSGVGNVVTYAAGYTQAKSCVGIEVNAVPAQFATNMKKEFENMMSWYGKECRPIELIHDSFLVEKHRKLIIEEATVIYINNFAFEADLMFQIKDLIKDMSHGTRIICTKSLLEERPETTR